MKVNILGTEYEIIKRKYGDDPEFEKRSIDGYHNGMTKQIVYCDMSTWPEWDGYDTEHINQSEKQTLRHEIAHAFLHESGLAESSLVYGRGWANNEEMVDWIALQGPKLWEAWRATGAL